MINMIAEQFSERSGYNNSAVDWLQLLILTIAPGSLSLHLFGCCRTLRCNLAVVDLDRLVLN